MNNVSLNRRFVETDDKEEAYRLLFNAYYKIVFDAVDRMRWNHPDTVVDPDAITSETFTKAFYKRKQIGEPEKLLEWLIRVAENLMIDEIRKSRQKRRLAVVPFDSLSISERSTHYATSLVETDAKQAETNRYLAAQLLRLLQDQDREIVDFMLDGLKPKEIAEMVTLTSEAVQKKWERARKWLIPIARNLKALINCLPKERDRWIMERYFEEQQPLSEITKALDISRATVEKRVKRVIADWKKAARQNPEDPVSAMVSNKR